ncbi:DUF6750 family protein (plasmid) [Xenorhabdus stockiae]|uniref:DUF6750 family protein n=1 Tax=Xenorhabdus stockiae TaxID=351614 RepID=UPI003CF89C5A
MNVLNFLRNFPLVISIKAFFIADTARRYTFSTLIGLAGTLLSPVAKANDDIAGIFKSIARGAISVKDDIADVAFVIGIGFCVAGLLAMKNKKDNPRITVGGILTLFIVGLGLIALDQLISRGQKQMGLTPVSI